MWSKFKFVLLLSKPKSNLNYSVLLKCKFFYIIKKITHINQALQNDKLLEHILIIF